VGDTYLTTIHKIFTAKTQRTQRTRKEFPLHNLCALCLPAATFLAAQAGVSAAKSVTNLIVHYSFPQNSPQMDTLSLLFVRLTPIPSTLQNNTFLDSVRYKPGLY